MSEKYTLGDPCPSCSGSEWVEKVDGGGMAPCMWSVGRFFCEDGHVGEERKSEKPKRKKRSIPSEHITDSDSALRSFAERLGKERVARELEIAKKLSVAERATADAEVALTKARSAVEQARLRLTTAMRAARSEKEDLRIEMQRREFALLNQAKARRRFDLEFAGRVRSDRLNGGEDPSQNDTWFRERCAEIEKNYAEILMLVRGIDGKATNK